ncbi:hypothetical protein P8452_64167 [Trifolium repens]|nr:hypothetical protein P8452_64167 [Trifolium repens]
MHFLDIEGEVNGTQINVFTIEVDQDWRPVVFCENLLIVFEKLIPNDGIRTLESNHVHLVNQASHIHFFCNQVQSNDDDKVECILSFDLYDERVRRNLLPPDLLGDPILCCLENKHLISS